MFSRLPILLARARRPMMVALGLAAAAAATVVPTSSPAAEPRPSAIAPAPTPVPTAEPTFVPDRMDIPRLGLSAPVVVVGTEADGAMGSPTNAVDIGWWQGRRVGEGNALFAAHHDWKGRLGSFYNLADLEKGDEIVVRGEGRSLVFLVAGKAQVDGDADPLGILTDTTEPIVTLITCGGPFDRSIGHHLERVVVQAVLAPVQT